MIETEQQRRWWFATHPEYSQHSNGRRGKQGSKDSNSDKLDPEKVDAWADERLKYEKDPVVIELIKGAKRWFGTAGQNPESKGIMLAGAVFTPDDAALSIRLPMGGGGGGGSRIATPMFRPPMSGGAGSPSGPRVRPPTAPSSRSPSSPPGPPSGGEGGPGKWVEVRRGKYGLEHQSKMSGQPIRESGGKYYIHEYEVNGVKFDDYRDGALREYKGNYLNFIVKKAREFYQWFKGAKSARNQALRQAEAAQGVPIKWHVGPPNQVGAFRKAVGKVPGVTIEP